MTDVFDIKTKIVVAIHTPRFDVPPHINSATELVWRGVVLNLLCDTFRLIVSGLCLV